MSVPSVTGPALKAAHQIYADTLDRDDVEAGAPIDATLILDEIRDCTGIRERAEVIALFRRCVALSNVLEEPGVADALDLAEGDAIPDDVFDVAANLSVRETQDRSRLASSDFPKDEFLAAVRAKRAN